MTKTREFDVLSAKNIDIVCKVRYTAHEDQSPDFTIWYQVLWADLKVIVYVNGSLRKFNFHLGWTEKEVVNRFYELIAMFYAMWYEVPFVENQGDYNLMLESLYSNLWIDFEWSTEKIVYEPPQDR